MQDGHQLVVGYLAEVELNEAIAKGARQHLASTITSTGGILGGEQRKLRMRLDRLLRLGNKQLAIVVENSVEGFEHLGGRQVEFVEYEPISFAHRLDQNALLEDNLAVLIGAITANVFLKETK